MIPFLQPGFVAFVTNLWDLLLLGFDSDGILVFSRFDREFVEELELILEFSIFVDSHGCI